MALWKRILLTGSSVGVGAIVALALIELVSTWLATYMMSGNAARAKATAAHLADHTKFKSHNRFINRDKSRQELGLEIEDLESDWPTQDAVLSAFHAASHTFTASPTIKIIENHLGKAFIKSQAVQQVIVPPGPVFPQPPQLRRGV